jgi:hypothetical protein
LIGHAQGLSGSGPRARRACNLNGCTAESAQNRSAGVVVWSVSVIGELAAEEGT